MIKKRIPLIKNSDYSSIYYDFKRKEPYIQWFQGYNANGHSEEYSKNNTFWLSQLLMGISSLVGIILDKIFVLPVFISLVIAYAVGAIFAKLLIRILIGKYMGEREYRKITKREVIQIIERPEAKRLWRIWLIEVFLIVLTVLSSIINLSGGHIQGKDFIMSGICTFSIFLIHDSIYPRLTLKARKILKKQLKEGKFDD